MGHGEPGEPGADVICTKHLWKPYGWAGVGDLAHGGGELRTVKEYCVGCDAKRTREVSKPRPDDSLAYMEVRP